MTLSQLDKVPLVLVLTAITCLCSYMAWATYKDSSTWLSYKEEQRKLHAKRLDFLVIGAAECGTENLNHLLKQHPQLKNKIGAAHFFDTHYEKGVDYYMDKLPSLKTGQLSFESTPAYFTNPDVPRRVHDTNPNIKLVLTLCDPVLRMLNHIRKAWETSEHWPLKTKLNHFETFDFTANFPANLLAIILHDMPVDFGETSPENVKKLIDYMNTVKDEKPSCFITRSFYAFHLNRWLKYFDKDQMFITTSKEIKSNPFDLMSNITDFLGVEKFDNSALDTTTFIESDGYKKQGIKGAHYVSLLYEWFKLADKQSLINLPDFYEEANLTYVKHVAQISEMENL